MRAAALLLLGLLAAPAAAQDAPPAWPVKLGGKTVLGSAGYVGRSGYLQLGSTWRIRGGYWDYRYDGATDTVRTGSLRAGYQGESLALALVGSVTPLADAYRSVSWGAEGGWTFLPEEGFVEEWGLDGWWSQTRHSQVVPATPALPRERTLVVNQHDLGLGASVTAFLATLTVDGYASLYDQDYFEDLNAVARRRPRLSAAVSLVNGFPRGGASARLDVEALRWLTPYASVSYTSYRVSTSAPSRSLGAGASLRAGPLTLDGGWELTRQSGADDARYVTLGGSVRF